MYLSRTKFMGEPLASFSRLPLFLSRNFAVIIKRNFGDTLIAPRDFYFSERKAVPHKKFSGNYEGIMFSLFLSEYYIKIFHLLFLSYCHLLSYPFFLKATVLFFIFYRYFTFR